VSVCELSVKHSLGKLPLPAALDRFVLEQREKHGITVLPLEERAISLENPVVRLESFEFQVSSFEDAPSEN